MATYEDVPVKIVLQLNIECEVLIAVAAEVVAVFTVLETHLTQHGDQQGLVAH